MHSGEVTVIHRYHKSHHHYTTWVSAIIHDFCNNSFGKAYATIFMYMFVAICKIANRLYFY